MKKSKLIILLALLIKAMEQLDNILSEDSSSRITHWKSQIYTIFEDVQDYLNEE